MPDWDYSTDIAIVGSGGGALTAALTARTRGLEALVIEKTDLIGGSTAMSGGGLWFPNNPVMQADGIPDSDEEALAHFDAVVGDAGPASSPQRRRTYITKAQDLVRFLQGLGMGFRRSAGYPDYYTDRAGASDKGRTLEAVPFDARRLGPWEKKLRPGMSAGLGLIGSSPELTLMSYYNRSVKGLTVSARVQLRTWAGQLRGQHLLGNGGALTGWLFALALERGADVWTEAPVSELIVEDGRVVGVVARHEGKAKRVRARQAVLLASGGFSRNGEMRARYGGDHATTAQWSRCNPGDTGEILQMAIDLGAATDFLDEAIWMPMITMPDGSHPMYPSRQTGSFSRARWRPGSIQVDSSGQRYANEAMSHMELGQIMFARDKEVPALPSWIVFDDDFRKRCLFGALPARMPEQWITDGFVKRSSTLEDLARQCGIDPEGLSATVKTFNEDARAGVDTEFHRGETAYDRFMGDPSWKPNNCLAPIETSPFYAVATYPCDLGTFGGVLTDEHARVISTSGSPIPGLYATGNVTAGVTGRYYLGPGASIGPTCTFGFVAANDVASPG